jgi:hypothetical protein
LPVGDYRLGQLLGEVVDVVVGLGDVSSSVRRRLAFVGLLTEEQLQEGVRGEEAGRAPDFER